MREPPERLWHYTTAAAFQAIVVSKTIRATSVLDLNDASEWRHALSVMAGIREESGSTQQPLERVHPDSVFLSMVEDGLSGTGWDCFIASFSAARDLLSQWRAYSRPYGGFCLGFEHGGEISGESPPQLLPCVYSSSEQRRLLGAELGAFLQPFRESWYRDRGQAVVELVQARLEEAVHRILPLLPTLKHPAFSEEQEWRLVCLVTDPRSERLQFRESSELLVPFITVPWADAGLVLREVIVGPGPEQARSGSNAVKFLAKNGLEQVLVHESAAPLRVW